MYILEVLLALFIATAPAIVGAGLSKYKITGFPPTQCRSYGEFSILFINPSSYGYRMC